MNPRIKELLDKLDLLENELREEFRQQADQFQYRLDGTRVRFDRAVAETHRKLRTGSLVWLRSSSLRNILSAPFIYVMVVPIGLLDLTVTAYQQICFRLYGISRVKRSKYIVIDRQYLSYLNLIEKLNCLYCGYANGVIAYVREVISRTEQYWCPIKHARNPPDTHSRYARFLDYGDAENIERRVLELRDLVKSEGHE